MGTVRLGLAEENPQVQQPVRKVCVRILGYLKHEADVCGKYAGTAWFKQGTGTCQDLGIYGGSLHRMPCTKDV